ncbi:unnamed protein product [Schistocephalus solidus]|uniref:TAXi_C domain-containing protein n=1 Tax=Schistocephalus solidus TaxID=70667 RepID=A0A183S7R4_SCHSO|nr:unnamed protein product [Schistocephalus solidus]
MAKDESYLYTIKIHTTRTRVLKGGYNGGVVLLHLDRLRQRGWPDLWQRALEALLNVSMFLPAAEQDIMSVLVWMNKDLFYPLPCVWNLQLNPVAYMSACLHSRSATCWGSVERPHAKLLHMNRRDKFELTDDEHLTSADTPETEKYEVDNGGIFEIPRDLPLVPRLLEDHCELVHQLGSTMLINLSRDRVRASCFPAGELLHGSNVFLERGREIKVGVDFHFTQVINGCVGDAGGLIENGFEHLILLDEQSIDGCVVVIEPVFVLTMCAAEDIQGSGLDGVSQLTPAVLHGGVRVDDWKVA